MSDAFDEKNFGAESEVKSQTIDWGRPGDHIVGTFINARHGIETPHGENSIYTFLAERGSFHRLVGKGAQAKPVDTPTAIGKGEQWSTWGRGDIFRGAANSLKVGQIVKIEYVGDGEGKKGTFKDVKIFAPKNTDGTPKMNEEWLKSQDMSAADFAGL